MAECKCSWAGARAVVLLAIVVWQLPEGACFTQIFTAPRPAVHHARDGGERCRLSSRLGRALAPAYTPHAASCLLRRRTQAGGRGPLRALSTPAAEYSPSECSMRELSRLLAMEEAEFDVREAAGMEGDCVAHLRCSVFNQGKDMYRSQRHKMRTSPHYLLAGIYKTTLMVAVVRALTPRARQVCKDIVLADMQELVDQAWISPWEHAHLLEQLEYEWQGKSELVVGSVDCSVHEMLDSSLTLRRWVYVSSMAVRKDVRHRGVGEQLLMLAVAHSRKIFGVKHMFLHVEERNGAALRLYQRAGFARGDMEDSHINAMDRMLRLVLQVPSAATLYSRSLSLSTQGAHGGASTVRRASSPLADDEVPSCTGTHAGLSLVGERTNKMHQVGERLAAQKETNCGEVGHSITARSPVSLQPPLPCP